MASPETSKSQARISEFEMTKGLTSEATSKLLSITVQLPLLPSDEDVATALNRAEYILDSWLGTPTPEAQTQIPNLDPEDLVKHKWKGKKTGEKQWSEGSLSWGWDFADNFKKETLQVLDKGALTIGEYEFSLNESATIVNAKKKKEKKH